MKTQKQEIIWVGRIDQVYGDSMIAFGRSEKEVENLLFKEYKEMGKPTMSITRPQNMAEEPSQIYWSIMVHGFNQWQ